MEQLRIGLAGFGQIGRQIYTIAQSDPRVRIAVVAGKGPSEVLHHLLSSVPGSHKVMLDGKNMVGPTGRTRLLHRRDG